MLLPRRAEHGEHVDDHQAEIAATLDERGLVTVRFPEDLTREDLQCAADRLVISRADMGADPASDSLDEELYALLDSERGVA